MSSKFYKQAKNSTSDLEVLQGRISALQNIITRMQPLTFLLDSDTIYEFDEALILDFPKYTLYTDIRVDSGKLSFLSYPLGAKVKISIRLMYNWLNKDYSPRFKYNLIVNNLTVLTDSSDVNDSSEYGVKNVSNIVFVFNFLKDDIVEIRLTKPSDDDSIILFRNSNIEFSYV